MNLTKLSAVELGQQIASKELSSRQVTEYFLERLKASDQQVGAFTQVSDQALREAEQVDLRLSKSDAMSSLAGVPVAIKDVLCTQHLATTCSSKMLRNFHAPYTATAVQQLMDSGMVMLGKTNMDEFAMGGSTENSAFGITKNPWDLERTPGGSSGGSAAALAAGMAPLAIGSDTGGSVRQPAAFCGVCGLKPTYGRISRYGLVAFASSLDQVGPLAHHVEDLAATLQILAGHDPRDSTSLPAPVPDYQQALKDSPRGLKVGVIREHLDHPALDVEIRASIERAIELLKSAGASIVDVHFPHTEYAVPTYYLIAPCEASSNLSRYDGVHYGFRAMAESKLDSPLDSMVASSRSQGFGDEVKRRIMLGTFALSAGYYDAYYKKALQVRRLISEDYRQAFEQADLLLGPVAPTTAYPLGEKLDDPVQMYLGDLFSVGANLAGLPALSIPAGLSQTGMPLAVQLQAPALEEPRLLNCGYKLQLSGMFTPQLAANFEPSPQT